MLTVQMYIPGEDERSKLLRRVLVRRAMLMLTLLLRSISKNVRNRYPTLQDLVKNGILFSCLNTSFFFKSMTNILNCLGIMTKTEKACYESITPVVNLFWVPANWFVAALNEAVEDGFLTNHSGNKLIMEVYQLFTDTH